MIKSVLYVYKLVQQKKCTTELMFLKYFLYRYQFKKKFVHFIKSNASSNVLPTRLLISIPLSQQGLDCIITTKKGCPEYDIKLHLVVKLQFGISGEDGVPLPYHYSQVHSNLEW